MKRASKTEDCYAMDVSAPTNRVHDTLLPQPIAQNLLPGSGGQVSNYMLSVDTSICELDQQSVVVFLKLE